MKRRTTVTSGKRFTIMLVAFGLLGLAPASAQTVTLTKQFLTQPLPGDTVEIQYTLTNHTASFLQTVGFSEDLDALLTGMTSLGSSTNTCGGSVSGSSIMNFNASFMQPSSSCTVSVTALIPQSATAGTYVSTSSTVDGNIFGGAAFSDPGATANMVVSPIMDFEQTFLNDPVQPGEAVTLSFTLTNNSATKTLTDITFTDDLDAALSGLVATGLPLGSICADGEINGTSLLSFANGRLAPTQSCEFQITVIVPPGAARGGHTNSTSAVSGNIDGIPFSSGTSSDDLKVDLPRLAMSFSDDPIFPGDTVTLDFSITNPTADTFTDISFFHDLDAALSGLNVNSLPATGFCGGGSISGVTSLSMTGGSLASLTSCNFSVVLNVPNGAAFANHRNTTDSLFSTFAANVFEGEPASDALQVLGVPTLSKTFLDNPVAPGEQVTLQYTITNLNRGDDAANIAFGDDLDAALSGLVASGLPLANICGTGSALTGTGVLNLSGANLGPQGSCSFSVTLDVPGSAVAGAYASISTEITSVVGGIGVIGAVSQDDLVVEPATLISLNWSDDPAAAGSTATMDITLTNSSLTSAASNISFDLTFYEGLPTSPAAPTTTCDGDLVFTPLTNPPAPSETFPSRIAYGFTTPGTLAPGASCTIQVVLDIDPGVPAGLYTHTSSGVTSTIDAVAYVGPPGSDDLVVAAGPSLSMVFTDDPTSPGDTVNLEFTLTHESQATTDATGVGFTVDLDAALSGLASTGISFNDICGIGSSISGTGLLTMSGGTLAPEGTCTFSVAVVVPVAAAPADYPVTSSAVTSTVSGLSVTGNPSSNTLTVAGLEFSKSFLNGPFLAGETVTLEYTLNNISPTETASSMVFTDNLGDLISGLLPASLPAAGSCGAGSAIINSGSLLIFSGGELAPLTSCTIAVTFVVPAGTTADSYSNSSGALSLTFGGSSITVAPANASFSVIEPVSLATSFTNDPVHPGGSVDLEFTIANTHSNQTMTHISFSDDLDAALAGLVASGLPANGICGIGSSISGTNLLTFSGGSLAADSSCTFSVTVQVDSATPLGAIGLNTTSEISGQVNGISTTGTAASDSLFIASDPPPGFALNFSPSTIGVLETSTLIFSIDNSGATNEVTNLAFTHNLPTGLVVAAVPNVSTNCNLGTVTAAPGTNVISYSGGSTNRGSLCTISVDVVGDGAGAGANVNLSGELTSSFGNSGTATNTLIVTESPVIGVAKQAGITVDNGNGTFTTTLSLVLENFGDVPLSNVQVTDYLVSTFTAPASFSVGGLTSSLTANAAYNGDGDSNLLAGTDSLALGATATISFDVTFNPNTATGPFLSQAAANGTGPSSAAGSDLSDDGTDPDINGNGNPREEGEDDPTFISFIEIPVVGVAQQVGGIIDNGNSTFTVTTSVNVENLGNVPLANLQITDTLTGTFAAPATYSTPIAVSSAGLTPNAGYDGDAANNLLAGTDSLAVGATATISFRVTFTPNGETGPFQNQSSATANSPALAGVSDDSDNGANPDPNGNGDPGEAGENDPTPIAIAGTIGDLVYRDDNANGVHDAGEPGLAGVVVFLDSNASGLPDPAEASLTTDVNGAYDFSLVPASYNVTVDETTLPSGAILSSGSNPIVLTLNLLEDHNDADFGYSISNSSIGDTVWEDLNADGVQDVGEPGIENVTVQLQMTGGGAPSVQTTDEFGNYSFTNLSPGDFTITVTDTNNVLDGAILTAGTNPQNKTLVAGEIYDDADFGYCFPVVIVTQPESVDLCLGDELVLSVTAEGSALTYQWKRDGDDISGATSAIFTIPFVELNDRDDYSVVVNGSCGSVTSVSVEVDVNRMRVVVWPRVLVQGINPVTLSANVSCALQPASSTWSNLFTGEIVAVDTDTVTLAEVLTRISVFRFEITDATGRRKRKHVIVLASRHHHYRDFNNDACNSYQDVLDFISMWGQSSEEDPNDDGIIDVRDFLFINLDGCEP